MFRSNKVRWIVCFLFFAGFGTGIADVDDKWKQFRGSSQMGVAGSSSKPPVKWDLEKNARWKVALPGVGWSSPVYSDGKVWLTSAVPTNATKEQIEARKKEVQNPQIKTVAASVELKVLCVDLESGKLLFDRTLRKVARPDMINPMNSYASPTAVISGEKVICHFGSYGTWCLDSKNAETIWHRTYVVDHSVGPGSSPVIFGQTVILVCDGMDKQFVVGLDLVSGREKWLAKRPPIRQKNPEFKKAYSTPLLVNVQGRNQAVVPGAQWIVAYDPENGKELWKADHGSGFSVTPMAVYHQGLIIFSTGYGRPQYVAVDPTGSGNVTETHVKWKRRNAPAMPSFIAADGEVLSVNDKGILFRLDAKSGEILEQKRVGGNFSASPLLANGHLYLSSREGAMTVMKVDDEFQKVSKQKFGSPLMASPVVFQNDLIVRTKDHLFRIGK